MRKDPELLEVVDFALIACRDHMNKAPETLDTDL